MRRQQRTRPVCGISISAATPPKSSDPGCGTLPRHLSKAHCSLFGDERRHTCWGYGPEFGDRDLTAVKWQTCATRVGSVSTPAVHALASSSTRPLPYSGRRRGTPAWHANVPRGPDRRPQRTGGADSPQSCCASSRTGPLDGSSLRAAPTALTTASQRDEATRSTDHRARRNLTSSVNDLKTRRRRITR